MYGTMHDHHDLARGCMGFGCTCKGLVRVLPILHSKMGKTGYGETHAAGG